MKWCITSIKKDSYYDGIRELESKGYLLPIYEGSNIYNFYEKPKSEKPKDFSENETRSTDFQNRPSDFPYRNNTNITEIKQDRTIGLLSFDDTSFAVGERGGCGKAATASKDDYVNRILARVKEQPICENPNVLIDKYF